MTATSENTSTHATSDPKTKAAERQVALPVLATRGVAGGVLMGLANLVPGISGGTMLVAAGIYPRFINAIAEVTTFKFRKPSLVVLGSVVVAALAAIVLLAGTVKGLVVDQRWIMYSIFIGLTLGGVPIVWKMIDKRTTGMWTGAVLGFAAMAVLAIYQGKSSSGSSVDEAGFVLLLLAGIAGASAMILPGVSGGYLLLVLGVYVPILAGIDLFKDALKEKDMELLMQVGKDVILPVGLGVVVGIVVVSNLLRMLLKRCERPTLGVLVGLLFGAVVGLWPFQHGVAPEVGTNFKAGLVAKNADGEFIVDATGKVIKAEDYPTAFFKPTPGQVGGSLALILGGFAATSLVARLGKEE